MLVAEITKASYDFENYKQIMGVVARRLQSEGEVWRHVYKSLLLLEYMCKHGPQKVCSLPSNADQLAELCDEGSKWRVAGREDHKLTC